MTVLRRTMFVAAGGACGATARVLLATLLPMAVDRPHWSIAALLLVNLSGSLMAGFLRGVLEAKQQRGGASVGVGDGVGVGAGVGGSGGEWLDAFLIVGFCGGYTSYSGFIAMVPAGSALIAAATLCLCPLVALLGMLLGVRLSGGYPARPASL
jgi:fluoride ion exporter CrcB/FEX